MFQTYFIRKPIRITLFLSYPFLFHNTALFAEETPRAETQKPILRYSIERDPYSVTTDRRNVTGLTSTSSVMALEKAL